MKKKDKKNLKDWSEEYIKRFGLLNYLESTNLKFSQLFSIVGETVFTNEIMINFIKEIVNTINYNFLTPTEINEDPIFYSKNDHEYKEITAFRSSTVVITVWDFNFTEIIGEFHKSYEDLPLNSLQEIFDMLVRAYSDGRFKDL